jgi:hypothetical protein
VAIDGRSAGGMSTVADRLAAAVAGAVVVHTDDVALHQGYFDWDELLVDGILGPASRGEDVAFRPPAWVERGREGVIGVSAGATVLLVEGVGSLRDALTPWLDAAVWVQSDASEAYRRGVERDVRLGRTRDEAVAFWDEWMVEEVPFLAADRPWSAPTSSSGGHPTRGSRGFWSAQRAQARNHPLREGREEPRLVVPRSVEDEVVEPPVDVGLDLGHDLVGVVRDDPP